MAGKKEGSLIRKCTAIQESHPDYQLLKDCLADCKTHHSNMVKKIESDISSQQLKADKLINDIFNKVKCINRTPEIISRARDRRDIGNPPGKDNSLGDAINWESLLHSVPKNKEIHIISGDRDFHSPLDKTKLNEFLFNEWKEEKNCEPQFFNTLSSFFNRYFPDINLADEKEKVQLIESLSASPNFRLTHIYIEELSKYNSFTSSQATGLFDALINNDQINRIIIDDDIKKFYDELYHKHKTNLSDYRDKIENLLSDDSK